MIHNGCVASVMVGDNLEALRRLPTGSVNCCVTSPPYFGLRDYGHEGQIGLEETPEAFIARLVEVFAEVRRVLRDDGTCWVNMGDSYAPVNYGAKSKPRRESAQSDSIQSKAGHWHSGRDGERSARVFAAVRDTGVKQKDLLGVPWMLAFALRADGWYLRQEIIWHKPNPMPESVRDRCTKAHEHIFLLTKSSRYWCDFEAIKEPVASATVARLSQNVAAQAGSDRAHGGGEKPMKALRSAANSFKRENSKRAEVIPGQTVGTHRPDRKESDYDLETRNKRSVWTVAPRAYKGAHFAVYPPELIEPCILAGCPPGGLVLDPFGGSGTTGGVSLANGRNALMIELSPDYAALMPARVASIVAAFKKR